MSRSRDGNWTAKVKLPAGSYRFRYRADGQWFTDYAAFGIEQGLLGIDSIVWVVPDSWQPADSEADHVPA
jgi:hypothetical protein